MAALTVQAEVVAPAVRYTGAFMGGSMQRIAWEQSTALGFFVTGLMMAGGALGAYMLDGIGAAALEGIAASGASTAGWALTGAFLIPASSRSPAAQGKDQDQTHAQAIAARMRAQLSEAPAQDFLAAARVPEMENIRIW